MTKRAWVYIWFILLSGAMVAGKLFFSPLPSTQSWIVFGLLTGLAVLAQLFKSEAPSHQLYHPTLILFFAGVLLLPPNGFALMVILTHLIEWAKELSLKSKHLRAWYLQPFNISMHILVGIAARLLYTLINPVPGVYDTLQALVAAFLAALAYVLLNHLIVGQALVLARGVSWKESGILNLDNLSTDFVMLTMGYVAAILMERTPWLVLPVLTPLYLIYRALSVPRLKQQVNTDPKTGLWNAKYFMNTLETELSRSTRFSRQLTVVMADLDLLRNINNAYGHLGGDAVLVGVADILKDHFREYDVIARFGGEEFAVMLPETSPEEAYPRIEAVRAAVAAAEFEAPTTRAKIKATMSFGVAGNYGMAAGAKEIIHHADVAVYEAKIQGRNQTKIYSREMAYSLGIYNFEKVDAEI